MAEARKPLPAPTPLKPPAPLLDETPAPASQAAPVRSEQPVVITVTEPIEAEPMDVFNQPSIGTGAARVPPEKLPRGPLTNLFAAQQPNISVEIRNGKERISKQKERVVDEEASAVGAVARREPIEIRRLPKDIVEGEGGNEGLIVKYPNKPNRWNPGSWKWENKIVPNKYILFPGTNTYQINPKYEEALKELLDILSTNLDNWKTWDFWQLVAALFPIVTAGIGGASLIYYKRTNTSSDDNTVFNVVTASITLAVSLATMVVALLARYFRNVNNEMLNIGTESLKAMGEETEANAKVYMRR